MARPLRIEFNGALYHVTSRGDRREAIYEDDADRLRFLALLGQVAADFNWVVHAYCLMTNHYHLVVETPDGNLSKGMRQLNGVFTQYSNRRHRRVGHLFQGRFKAILVDADSYLLELARYVVLNPVRAGMVSDPGAWPWSSYLAMIGVEASPPWLATDGLLAVFGKRRSNAVRRYMAFVAEGVGAEPIWQHLRSQVFLGDEDFVARSLRRAKLSEDVNIPKAQRRLPPPPLAVIERKHRDRDAAIAAAYATGGYSYQQIAEHFGVHFTTVGRVVRTARRLRTDE
ncbi:MAG: REP-associated tyrosine transposase [Rehaibacterium terrae]|uniref:REP-associated tyrosine transposase n=1 Tax=Rehaibacterium terrae TaxID=1341696 RepID=UPI00391C6245